MEIWENTPSRQFPFTARLTMIPALTLRLSAAKLHVHHDEHPFIFL
ncbi:MAG: hypothetical protein MR051_03520 [Lentisphaeria bacterium]|nr:hypothetical protein [Lentisphaeria bacterium]